MLPKALANRFRVFRVVKAYMERFRDCPTATYVAAELGMSPPTAGAHMLALDGADGLPFRMKDPREVAGQENGENWKPRIASLGDNADVYTHFQRQGLVA